MKFMVQMKDPDTLGDAINDAVGNEVGGMDLSADEKEAVSELRRQAVAKLCAKWFEFSEYLCVQIDTEADTCTVMPVKR